MRGRHRTQEHGRRGRRTMLAGLALVLGITGLQVPSGAALPAAQATTRVQRAVSTGAAAAARRGVTTYAAVIDRADGRVLGRTGNAGTQVASESLVKMLLAAYYLVQHHGRLPESLDRQLRYMIAYSDDATASRLWTNAAVPTVTARYGLTGIGPARPNPGYWGATRVSADGLARFLYRAGKDPVVGPWLVSAMRAATDRGSDGYNQNLGFNRIAGAGSKQGWGADNWVGGAYAVHSAGITGRYVAVVLQSGGPGTYGVMPGTATRTAALIDAAVDGLRRPTAVRIIPATTVALANRRLRITTVVTSSHGQPVPRHKVRLYSKTEHGHWTYRGVGLTNSKGRSTFRVSSGTEGHRFKVVVPATDRYAAAQASRLVYVRRAMTGIGRLPDSAGRHQVLVATGRTGTGYAGQRVRIQHVTSRGWVGDGASIVAGDGTFKIYFRAPRHRDVRFYRAYIPLERGSYQALTWSQVERVVVR